jgi:CDP-paratose 2-epimerase
MEGIMDVALITGSCGLIGSQSVRSFAEKGFDIAGVDNNMRAYYFGLEASTDLIRGSLEQEYERYHHYSLDIRDYKALESVFQHYQSDVKLVIHTAAQPSHDWAASEPLTDFQVNAGGTLNLLELTRKYCPQAVFIFTSTNKVYGDRPNALPLIEKETRWEVREDHPCATGINESMSIDACCHSLFGTSKAAADLLVQEYGRYFGMKTVCLRGGCLTGPQHAGVEQHGFLAYLMKCCLTGKKYIIYGYLGKQVRDNIHSYDLVEAFYHFYQNPRPGEVYNIGGGRQNHCSLLEAVAMCEQISGRRLISQYHQVPRVGDHIWYISDLSKFHQHYPRWQQTYTLERTLQEIYQAVK